MGRPVRLFEPERLYFITNRTFQGRLLLRPSPHVNQVVGGIVARALHLFPQVELFAFVVMSNHVHMIARAAEGALSAFMGYVQGNLARKVGRHHGWSGAFWQRRFSAEPILDDAAVLDRVTYIFGHGAKEGLVDDPACWPGLNCIPELVHGVRRLFPWYDWTAAEEARRKGEPGGEERFLTLHPLRLAPLPGWETLDPEERCRRMRDLLDQARGRARAAREGRPALGTEAVREQDPHAVPAHVSHRRRPLCHASSAAVARAFRATYRAFLDAYWRASALWRAGCDAVFPPYAFKPPLPYGWRLSAEPASA